MSTLFNPSAVNSIVWFLYNYLRLDVQSEKEAEGSEILRVIIDSVILLRYETVELYRFTSLADGKYGLINDEFAGKAIRLRSS